MAKQVRAVQQFLDGEYLNVSRRPNYDGYPLFNSHLVEYLFRVAAPPIRAVARAVAPADAGDAAGTPDPQTILWVTLFWNAALSSLAVALAVVLGSRFGAGAGLLAGALAALSPLDVSAAHYAAGDTAAAFFALAAVHQAVRVVETGRLRNYVLAALAVAAAFSSKYNGGVAGAALLAAHALRHPGREVLVSGAAWRRAAAAAAAAAAGLALTSPALLVNPAATLATIKGFFAWISQYGLSEAQRHASPVARAWSGLRGNALLLARATGPLTLAAALAALALARPRKLVWAIAALPLAHVLVAFPSKPAAHPVHHLPIVLPLLVLGAAGAAALLARERPLPLRAAGAVATLGAVLWLASATRDELFFFGRSDTHRVAETWAMDSVPPALGIGSRHAFRYTPPPPAAPRGVVHFLVPKFHRRPRPGEFRLGGFALEEHSLPVFRNPAIDVIVNAPGLLAPDFDLPLWQPLPSTRSDTLVFVDAPAFYRSPLVRDLEAGGSLEVTAVAPRPLDRAWLFLRGGAGAASVAATFGGRAVERQLGAGEVAVLAIERPRLERSAREGHHFYRWRVRARLGGARVALVTDEQTLGRLCFSEGLFAEAERALAAAGASAGPGRRLERAIAGLAAGSLSPSAAERDVADLLAVDAWDREAVRARFGVHPDWLDGLPYVAFGPADLADVKPPAVGQDEGERDDAGQAGEGAAEPPAAAVRPGRATRAVTLGPGRYEVEVAGTSWNGPVGLTLRDSCGRVVGRGSVDPPPGPCPSGSARGRVQAPPAAGALSLEVWPAPGGALPEGLALALRPDVLGTVTGRLDLLRRLLGRPAAGEPGPADYDALVAGAEAARVRGAVDDASRLYRLAAAADPGRRAARERLGELSVRPPPREIGARFRGGVELSAVRVDDAGLRPGGTWSFEPRWSLPGDLARGGGIVCWVHGVDAAGRTVFQGDRPIFADGRLPPRDDRIEACLAGVSVPAGVAPGTYELRAGLWRPQQLTKIGLLDAAVPHDRLGVSLGTVTVSPASVAPRTGEDENGDRSIFPPDRARAEQKSGK